MPTGGKSIFYLFSLLYLFPSMYSRTLIALSLALLGGLSSCGDDGADPTPTPKKTASELLMAKSWKITAATEKEGSKPAENIYTQQPACFRDNLYKFQTNAAFVLDEGATRCDQDDPQTMTGVWALSNNDKTLTGIFALSTQPGIDVDLELSGTIEELTATQLVLVDTETTGGVTTVTRTTFTAQ
jgi:hypothetical protein